MLLVVPRTMGVVQHIMFKISHMWFVVCLILLVSSRILSLMSHRLHHIFAGSLPFTQFGDARILTM